MSLKSRNPHRNGNNRYVLISSLRQELFGVEIFVGGTPVSPFRNWRLSPELLFPEVVVPWANFGRRPTRLLSTKTLASAAKNYMEPGLLKESAA